MVPNQVTTILCDDIEPVEIGFELDHMQEPLPERKVDFVLFCDDKDDPFMGLIEITSMGLMFRHTAHLHPNISKLVRSKQSNIIEKGFNGERKYKCPVKFIDYPKKVAAT